MNILDPENNKRIQLSGKEKHAQYFSPIDTGHFYTPYQASIPARQYIKHLVYFRKSSHRRKMGKCIHTTHHSKWQKHLGLKLTNRKIGQLPMRSAHPILY